MIAQRIYQNAQNTPEKVALSYRGAKMSYSDLVSLIEKTKERFSVSGFSTFLIQTEAPEALASVLAANLIKKRVIVLHKDIPSEQIEKLTQEYNALYVSALDDIPKEVPSKHFPESTFLGILSSGSEGNSKVIWKTNDNWEKAFTHQSIVFGISEKDRIFAVDALGYSANLNAVLHGLWQGSTVIIGSLKEASIWTETFMSESVSSVFMVPSHARLLINKGVSLSQIKSFVTAGEKLDSVTVKGLMSTFPEARITEYYGAAELGHVSYHQNKDILENPASVGSAFPEVEIDIIGNRITVESPYVSPDYQVLATVNDLGYFEEDKLILLGREGRMFNRRGLNIYAQEIENLAMSSGLVLEVALVKSIGREKLTLFYTSKREMGTIIKEDLRVYLDQKLPKSKQPNFFTELQEMPHSEAGKIDFKALSKMNEEELVE
ncbi:AMP-binding protein [Jiulongibacter sediminis]|uniref:AMP-binding protein n=1 Tax=Jiulongibacter sediminis TaxID=1605367 RepID=UPI0026F0ADE4|nr:AMP-binding protein [Jiulongibacter sediminis]